MMKSGSNSEGSGPFVRGLTSSFSYPSDRTARRFKGTVREVDLWVREFDLDGESWEVLWRACSSAIRESIAPFKRCARVNKDRVLYWEELNLKHADQMAPHQGASYLGLARLKRMFNIMYHCSIEICKYVVKTAELLVSNKSAAMR